jgi:hypothetical protein
MVFLFLFKESMFAAPISLLCSNIRPVSSKVESTSKAQCELSMELSLIRLRLTMTGVRSDGPLVGSARLAVPFYSHRCEEAVGRCLVEILSKPFKSFQIMSSITQSSVSINKGAYFSISKDFDPFSPSEPRLMSVFVKFQQNKRSPSSLHMGSYRVLVPTRRQNTGTSIGTGH